MPSDEAGLPVLMLQRAAGGWRWGLSKAHPARSDAPGLPAPVRLQAAVVAGRLIRTHFARFFAPKRQFDLTPPPSPHGYYLKQSVRLISG